MSDLDEMERMAHEALGELGLKLQIFNVLAVRGQAHVWCIAFTDPTIPNRQENFELTVSWALGSTYLTVKQDLKQQLQARVTPEL